MVERCNLHLKPTLKATPAFERHAISIAFKRDLFH